MSEALNPDVGAGSDRAALRRSGSSIGFGADRPRLSANQLLAAKQKEKVDDQNNHYRQLQDKAAGLVELVHHEPV